MTDFYESWFGVKSLDLFPFAYQHCVYYDESELHVEIIQGRFNPLKRRREIVYQKFTTNKCKEKITTFTPDGFNIEDETYLTSTFSGYFYELMGLQPLMDLLFGSPITPVRLQASGYPKSQNYYKLWPIWKLLQIVSIFDLPTDLYSSEYQVHYFLYKVSHSLHKHRTFKVGLFTRQLRLIIQQKHQPRNHPPRRLPNVNHRSR